MKHTPSVFILAAAAACLTHAQVGSPHHGEGGLPPPLAEEGDDGNMPAFEVGIDVTSRQLTYGLVDNRDPIFTLSGIMEWHGFALEAAGIFDTSHWGKKEGGYGDRKWRYQEFDIGIGYSFLLDATDHEFLPTSIEFGINYTYAYYPRANELKWDKTHDTQFINLGLKLPDLFLEPELTVEFDIDDEMGAIYFNLAGTHAIPLIAAAVEGDADPLTLELGAGIGLGNAKRNRYDADVDRFGFKDIGLSLALVWQPCECFTIAPYVAVYEQLDGSLRDAARFYIEGEKHRSTQFVGGITLSASF